MNVEVLLLTVMVGMTLLGYMVAINAHGPTRLSISYLLATIILAGTVWAIVQYVNYDLDARKMEEVKRLELEKKMAEERVRSQEVALKKNKQRMAQATKLNVFITKGTGLASSMINVDLQDNTIDFEVLVGRALNAQKDANKLKTEFEKAELEDKYFPQAITLIKEAMQLLSEAGNYYRLYYHSEDADQEALRERILRQRARSAYEKFQQASSLVASSS
jgi:hypothetical protein